VPVRFRPRAPQIKPEASKSFRLFSCTPLNPVTYRAWVTAVANGDTYTLKQTIWNALREAL
jgi:hypothetical protein